ncbi:hypothetical protein DFP72DRAFT_1146016 [Ephemerocybe angulata]|uniref:Uncharacterized protein n=1 Tax=Ephemerocybe angulata TaxID=980116 RepID=A0A8H6M1N5_9AGAR|nr:hypothetical protein DFP72DRAFT_1146016 [Tulosesus angulatus]
MQSEQASRGVLVHTAGFVLGSLGLLLSIVTSAVDVFLGHDTLVALTRTLAHPAASQTRQLELAPARRLRRVSSDTFAAHAPPRPRPPHHLRHLPPDRPRHRPRARRLPGLDLHLAHPAHPASGRHRPAARALAPPAAPPKRRHTLNRSTSSPQLSSFGAAGTFVRGESHAKTPHPAAALHTTDAQLVGAEPRKSRGKGKGSSKLSLRTSKGQPDSVKGADQWESVYVNEHGSPNTATAPPITPIVVTAAESLSEAPPKPRRPTLRKAKTLGDLLRRVPNSPGPGLPDAQKIESTTKKAFAFASSTPSSSPSHTPRAKSPSSKCKIKHKQSMPALPSTTDKEPKFTLSIKSPRAPKANNIDNTFGGNNAESDPNSNSNSNRNSSNLNAKLNARNASVGRKGTGERKRTQPYEAPYFWVPPDQVMAMNLRASEGAGGDRERGRRPRTAEGFVKSAPASRVVSPERVRAGV